MNPRTTLQLRESNPRPPLVPLEERSHNPANIVTKGREIT